MQAITSKERANSMFLTSLRDFSFRYIHSLNSYQESYLSFDALNGEWQNTASTSSILQPYPVMAVLPLTAMYNMWYNASILLTHK